MIRQGNVPVSENISLKEAFFKIPLNSLKTHPRMSNLLQYTESFSGVAAIIAGGSFGQKNYGKDIETKSKLLEYSGYNFPQVNHSHMPAFAMGPFPEEVICVNGGVEMHSGGQTSVVPTFGRSN